MLDTLRQYETPEGIELQLPLAGPAVRASAWLIDMLIRAAVYLAAAYVLALMDHMGYGIFLVLIFLLEWFYPVIFEAKQGATPGKKVMGLLVCHDNGTPLNWQSSLLRNLLRVADFLPFWYGFGLITMLANRDFKRLGDIAAGTVVVYAPPKLLTRPLPDSPPRPLPTPLDLTEQRAISDFAERSASLSKARTNELASLLADMTGKEGQAASQTLFGYAQWLRTGADTDTEDTPSAENTSPADQTPPADKEPSS